MKREKGIFSSLKDGVDGFFYKCEYLNQCSKVTPQCTCGGNSYCGEYKRRIRSH